MGIKELRKWLLDMRGVRQTLWCKGWGEATALANSVCYQCVRDGRLNLFDGCNFLGTFPCGDLWL